MTVTRLAVLVLMPILLGTTVDAGPSPEPELLRFRQAEGLSSPRLESELNRSAKERASVLAEFGELTHTDAEGRGPAQQMLREGLGPGTYGEVLGAGAEFVDVWRAWLASPTHRAVLIEPGWQTWGWGRANRGSVSVWVIRLWKP